MSIKKYKGAKGKCDVLASKIIRHNKSCMRCGSREYLQASHIVSRRFNATRTNLENIQPLCAKCHHHFTTHPVEFGKWVIETVGEKKYQELYHAAQTPTKVDWDAELERLKAIYDNLQNDWIID